jgi:probable H4MPT-linked C1 transfer pathway protein
MIAQRIAGFDIGGAHLKAALAVDGEIVAMRQIACPLWLGEEHLLRAFDEAADLFAEANFNAITMTGELAEIFPNREVGVRRILAMADGRLGGERLYYAGRLGFLDAAGACTEWQAVASANWRASAELIALFARDTLFIDIGSTTTDIVPIGNGAVWARGESDASRLLAGELVYTGAIRTSLMALAGRAPFAGHFYPLMAENFSTAADLYRLTGELDPADDLYPASDGRGKGTDDSMARLARMIGLDKDAGGAAQWLHLARYFREMQLRHLHDAAAQTLSAAPMAEDAPVVGAGAGHFLARAIAGRLGRPYCDFGALVPAREDARRLARVGAPAASVALLAGRVMQPR